MYEIWVSFGCADAQIRGACIMAHYTTRWPQLRNNRVILTFSGGQDSTTCLFWALRNGAEVFPLICNYGQRHVIEVTSALKVLDVAMDACQIMPGSLPGVVRPHEVLNLGPDLLKGESPLLAGGAARLEQYENAASLPGGLEKTFVPLRNQLFLTLAANRAAQRNCSAIITGVCQADNGGYPDCTEDFITAFEKASAAGTFTGEPGGFPELSILAPLMNLTKAQEVQLAATLPGCFEGLAYSHTSYDGKYPPTSKDHASLLRARGFEEAGLPDPLVMRAVQEGLMPLPKTSNYDGVRGYVSGN